MKIVERISLPYKYYCLEKGCMCSKKQMEDCVLSKSTIDDKKLKKQLEQTFNCKIKALY